MVADLGPAWLLVYVFAAGWTCLDRSQRGGAIVRALDALCAVSGNLFVSGGGVSFYFARRKPFAPFGGSVRPMFSSWFNRVRADSASLAA